MPAIISTTTKQNILFLFKQQDEKSDDFGFWHPVNRITTFTASELILEEYFFGQFLFEINQVISFCSHKPTLTN